MKILNLYAGIGGNRKFKNYVAFEHHYSEGYEIVKEPEEY